MISTAFLLPEIHPWLKEFFMSQNLMPIEDEAWGMLPTWNPVPIPDAGIRNQESGIPTPETARSATTVPVAAPPSPGNTAVVTASSRTQTPAIDGTALTADRCGPDVRNVRLEIPHPQCLTGIRPSATPVPFSIPVELRTDVRPSRHLLRILRPIPRPLHPAPNFRATLTAPMEPVRAHALALRRGIAHRIDRWRTRAPMPPAPVLCIPPPYDELLAVNVIAGTLGVLWRSIGWPIIGRMGIGNLWRRVAETMRTVNVTVTLHGLRTRIRMLRGAIELPGLHHAAAFALVLLLVLLPLKLAETTPVLHAARGRVLGATAIAVDAFRDGGTALTRSSFTEAIAAFDDARRTLEALPGTMGPTGTLGVTVGRYLPVIGTSIRRADDLRRAGVTLAAASSTASRGLAMLATLDVRDPASATAITAVTAAFTSARTLGESARAHLDRADPTLLLPLDRALAQLRRTELLLPIMTALSGVDRPRRILLAFQNPQELRPTGGFLGSIALLDVRAGHIEALELPGGGSYDVSGVSRLRVLPPEPLRLLSSTWQFHDANWFPDFPTSARKLRAFYAASGGPSVDAVVAVNASVLAELLATTGPITISDRSLGASDVLGILTNTIEDPTARATGTPKAILHALAPTLLERFLVLAEPNHTIAERLALLDLLLRALDGRDVLLAFTDDALQRTVTAAGWAGDLQPAVRDVLRVVHANIGGGKSDARTRDDLAHTAAILADGTIIDTVVLTRTHTGNVPSVDTPSERLAGFPNVDYLRVYVPRGAELLTAEGFTDPPHQSEPPPADAIPDPDLLATELNVRLDPGTGVRITEEFGRTAFGGWLVTPPNAQRTIRLVYRLPWRYDREEPGFLGTRIAPPQLYAIRIEQQPGTRSSVHHTIDLHPSWVTTWTSANLRGTGPHAWTLEDILTTDRTAGILLAPRTQG